MIRNKTNSKTILIKSIVIIISFIILFEGIAILQFNLYKENYNIKLNNIIMKIQEEYPEFDKNKIIEILNCQDNFSKQDNIFKKYGINIETDSILYNNEIVFKRFILVNILLLIIFSICIIAVFLKENYRKKEKIKEITRYIEELNNKNYKLHIDDNTEDELSILKNEIYKTTVMLKEIAENSINDKLMLKHSLSDISHQLKTPITSISVMLDTILENIDMEDKIKNEFIKDIKREIINISFLVNSLLKLSKLDLSSVEFIYNDIKILEIIDEAIKNVSIICDLKNIEIVVENEDNPIIKCDFKWQVEAITNIIKNCVEYSYENSIINIVVKNYNVYTSIEIRDYGIGIHKKDLAHIFEKFYKGENSNGESVGIGLALSKSIIESNNGCISVESEVGKGTKFIIKYFKYK